MMDWSQKSWCGHRNPKTTKANEIPRRQKSAFLSMPASTHEISIQFRFQSNSNQHEVSTAFPKATKNNTTGDKEHEERTKSFPSKNNHSECLLHFKIGSYELINLGNISDSTAVGWGHLRTSCWDKSRYVLEASPNVVITKKYHFITKERRKSERHNALIVFSDTFTRTNTEMSHEIKKKIPIINYKTNSKPVERWKRNKKEFDFVLN